MDRSDERGRPSGQEVGAPLVGPDSSQSPLLHSSTQTTGVVNGSRRVTRDLTETIAQYGAAGILAFVAVVCLHASLLRTDFPADLYAIFGVALLATAIWLLAGAD